MDAVDGLGSEEEAQGVGEEEVDAKEEEEREVVVARRTDIVVDEQEKEDDDGADECGEGSVEELFETGFAEDVAIGALDGV